MRRLVTVNIDAGGGSLMGHLFAGFTLPPGWLVVQTAAAAIPAWRTICIGGFSPWRSRLRSLVHVWPCLLQVWVMDSGYPV